MDLRPRLLPILHPQNPESREGLLQAKDTDLLVPRSPPRGEDLLPNFGAENMTQQSVSRHGHENHDQLHDP